MIDESCQVPRENLDDGFNPCRKQVVENGELCQYAHMYDVMNERYDREDETSYLDWVKRDRISRSTPSQSTDGGKIYSQGADGVEGFISTSGTLEPTTNAEIPSSKAVADYVAGAVADCIPNPLPVNRGGTGAKTRSLKSAAGLTLLPVIDSIGASGALNGYTSVTNIATFITSNNIRPEIAAAFENHIADAVANNNLLPTNALMMDYVDAHSMDTPPHKFNYAASPFPSDAWEGEIIINVTPVFTAKIGADTYVLARVLAYKTFKYIGTADTINLFTSLKPVGDYQCDFIGSTRIPMTFSVIGRTNTDGQYGFTPKGSAANLALNNLTLTSGFDMGNFDITSDLKCVFGEGSNTPGVVLSIDSPALMWYSAS